jgi:hypothetical protein
LGEMDRITGRVNTKVWYKDCIQEWFIKFRNCFFF